jgi:hypothetical protein
VITGLRFFRFVPKGTFTATVFAAGSIMPVARGAAKLKAVISLSSERAAVTVTVHTAVEPSAAVTV